jgi:hypothetical protein
VLPPQEAGTAGRGVVTTCRSLAEVYAAAAADAQDEPPLGQDTADLVAAILAPTQVADARMSHSLPAQGGAATA